MTKPNSPTLHLVKLSVGSESVSSLEIWQNTRLQNDGECWHGTRMMPKRNAELLNGGSIYWVIQGFIQARQKLLELRPTRREDGTRSARFVYEPQLILTYPLPRRPFQGWRYLKPEDAPPDLDSNLNPNSDEDQLPIELRISLRQAGLL
ncbi:MAG: DUF1489 domain-containing protein [Alphaproteobacteria bacterium]